MYYNTRTTCSTWKVHVDTAVPVDLSNLAVIKVDQIRLCTCRIFSFWGFGVSIGVFKLFFILGVKSWHCARVESRSEFRVCMAKFRLCWNLEFLYLSRGSNVRAIASEFFLVNKWSQFHSLPRLITLESATCRNRTVAVAYVRRENR